MEEQLRDAFFAIANRDVVHLEHVAERLPQFARRLDDQEIRLELAMLRRSSGVLENPPPRPPRPGIGTVASATLESWMYRSSATTLDSLSTKSSAYQVGAGQERLERRVFLLRGWSGTGREHDAQTTPAHLEMRMARES